MNTMFNQFFPLFPASRACLIVFLLFDSVIGGFYFVGIWTNGQQGLQDKYVLVLLVAVHSMQILLFLLEALVLCVKWTWGKVREKNKWKYKTTGLTILVLASPFLIVKCTFESIDGQVELGSKIIHYHMSKARIDQDYNVYYRFSDQIPFILLCKKDGEYHRCEYQAKGRGKYPIPINSITDYDKTVLAALLFKTKE